jgi:hypothetical protein
MSFYLLYLPYFAETGLFTLVKHASVPRAGDGEGGLSVGEVSAALVPSRELAGGTVPQQEHGLQGGAVRQGESVQRLLRATPGSVPENLPQGNALPHEMRGTTAGGHRVPRALPLAGVRAPRV